MKDLCAAEFNNNYMDNKERRAVCGSLERVRTVAVLRLSAKKVYLALHEEYFWKNMRRRLGAILDCLAAFFSTNKRSVEMLEKIGMYEV